jgi:1-acyl-sn-glycerol-3-phosphate acyltransferase
MLYNGVEHFVKLCFRFQIGTVQGLENLPSPPCIIAANHVSPYDPILMVLRLYPWLQQYNRKIIFLTNRKVIALFAPFYKFWGMFPGTKAGLNDAARHLKHGFPIGIFPNRDRKTKVLKRFHLGPVYLSAKTQVPIVPIGIKTNHEVYPSWSLSKSIKNSFYKKHFIIGKPYVVNKDVPLVKAAEELTLKVVSLIDKEMYTPYKIVTPEV